MLLCVWLNQLKPSADEVMRMRLWLATVLGVPFFGLGFLYAVYRLIVPTPALEASPKGFKVAAKSKLLTNLSWTPPVLVGTRLYLRDRKTIMSVDLG